MNIHLTYFLILGCTLAGPLLLSFDRKVAFYKKWKRLFPAMVLPAVFYVAWDIYFTSKGVWSFNEAYITGAKLFNLPVEELLFFFVVPYCAVFIYECIRCYFPRVKNKKNGNLYLSYCKNKQRRLVREEIFLCLRDVVAEASKKSFYSP